MLLISIPIKDVASFVSLPDEDGSILQEDVAHPILLQQYNYSWTMNSTSQQKQISNWIRNLSLSTIARGGMATIGQSDSSIWKDFYYLGQKYTERMIRFMINLSTGVMNGTY